MTILSSLQVVHVQMSSENPNPLLIFSRYRSSEALKRIVLCPLLLNSIIFSLAVFGIRSKIYFEKSLKSASKSLNLDEAMIRFIYFSLNCFWEYILKKYFNVSKINLQKLGKFLMDSLKYLKKNRTIESFFINVPSKSNTAISSIFLIRIQDKGLILLPAPVPLWLIW